VTVETFATDPLAERASDLAGVAERTGGRVVVEHVPFLAQVSLRLDPSLAVRAPYPLPLTPNTAWEEGPRAVLWLGPDEWLVLGPPHAGARIVAELEASLEGEHRSVVDVSANRVAIELGGPGRCEPRPPACSFGPRSRATSSIDCSQRSEAGGGGRHPAATGSRSGSGATDPG
jgi:sarcosine oxidase subunit gamma